MGTHEVLSSGMTGPECYPSASGQSVPALPGTTFDRICGLDWAYAE